MNSDYAIVFTTCPDRREAERIAERLVEDGSAACVNIIDKVTSIYRWKDKIERGTECLLVIKTRCDATDRVEGTIQGFSSYECPEVLVVPIESGAANYLAWIDNSIR